MFEALDPSKLLPEQFRFIIIKKLLVDVLVRFIDYFDRRFFICLSEYIVRINDVDVKKNMFTVLCLYASAAILILMNYT